MLHYIFQVIGFQVLFLLIYEVFLRKQSFFTLNRVYLLGTSALSFIIPFLQIETFSNVSRTYWVIRLPEVILGDPVALSNTSKTAMDVAGIAVEEVSTPFWMIVLLFGCILFAIWFLVKFFRIILLMLNNPRRWRNNTLLVSLKDSLQAFSFFNTIFIGSKISQKDRELIIQHELVHVAQRHSLDIIWFQILRILMWFNPCTYRYEYLVSELHEFTADRVVVANHKNKRDYYQQLLQQILQVPLLPLSNAFSSKSLIKKRIVMLKQLPSKRSSLWRYALIIPVIFGMLFYVSCEKEVVQDDLTSELNLDQYTYVLDMSQDRNSIDPGLKSARDKFDAFIKNHPEYLAWGQIDAVAKTLTYSIHHKDEEPDFKFYEMEFSRPDGLEYKILLNLPPFGDWEQTEVEELSEVKNVDVPYAVIDQVPALEACKDLLGEERKKCTSMEISKLINKNFNINIAKEFDLVGRQRISVFFRIGKDGYLKDVGARAPHPALEVEAKRVVNLLPKFIPGVHKGETVDVPYSLPILFEILE